MFLDQLLADDDDGGVLTDEGIRKLFGSNGFFILCNMKEFGRCSLKVMNVAEEI